MINFIKHSKIYLSLAAMLVLLSLVLALVLGVKLSRDFTGGSLLELGFKDQALISFQIEDQLAGLGLGKIDIQPKPGNVLVLKLKDIDNDTKDKILAILGQDREVELIRFESIGPVIGQELKSKAWQALVLASIFIILYIAWAFRKVSKPVSSWKFGVSAVLTLIHDVVVIFGVFVVLGKIMSVEMDSLFITALLTILGFSVHDTIVVFDRIRENLAKGEYGIFVKCVNASINQTLTRSINTSATTLFVLLAIFVLGGGTIKFFVLALILGILIGTYSSIFVASQLLLWWNTRIKF